jgi:hypothetical protein
MAGGSSPPVIGDPDAGQQPAVALVNRWPNKGEKDRCGRRGFSHDPRPPRRRRVQGRSPSGCKPKFISTSLCLLVGAALAATLAPSRTRGSEFIGAGFTATPASSKAEVRGESPSYRDRLFVGAALAATLCVIENQGFGVYRSGFHCDPCVIEGGGSGRKPLLQRPSFCRSGFSRDLCVIENQGFGVYRSGFHCDPCVIEGGGSGRKPLLQKPSFCRSGFSRDPLRHREPGFRSLSERLPLRPLRHRRRRFGAKAPPTETVFL